MKFLKFSLFVLAVLVVSIPVFAQDDDYWGTELFYEKQTFCSDPAWSPDGKWIAFSTGSDGKLYVIPAEGGEPVFIYKNEVQLIDPDTLENCDCVHPFTFQISNPCFTPDSKEVTFTRYIVDEELGTEVIIECYPDGGHTSISNTIPQIVSVNIFTGELRVLTDGTTPIYGSMGCWSHDGRYFCYNCWNADYVIHDLYSSNHHHGAITILDTVTGESWFPTEKYGLNYPMFTPDDTYILCSSGGRLYRIPFEGGEPVLITVVGSYFFFYDISTDGTWVLYQDTYHIDKQDILGAYNTITKEMVTLLTTDENNFLYPKPVFSPDGTKVCYIRVNEVSYRDNLGDSITPYIIEFDPYGSRGEPPDVVSIAAAYGTKLEITPAIGSCDFALSPDSKWMALDEDGDYSKSPIIWIAPAEGGQRTELFKYPDTDDDNVDSRLIGNITFSPDSQEIYFTLAYYETSRESILRSYPARGSNIESVNINTGVHRVVIECAADFSWSNNGRYLVYINRDYRIFTDPSQAVRNGVITLYDTVTGETRYLIDGEQNSWNYVYPEDGGNNERTGIRYENPIISPDRSHILCMMYKFDEHRRYGCTVPIEGGEPEILPINFNNTFGHPQYSPDGKWILYWDENGSNVYRLYLYNVETTEIVQLVGEGCDSRVFGMNPHFGWTRDGSKIYYSLKDLSGEYNIYTLDFDPDSYLKIVSVEAELPGCFVILNNYPNPFNPATTIEFIIPEAGFTRLVIYNITGQRVRELMAQDMPAGVHSVVWDGRDENDAPVSSGVFVSRLTSGENVVSNRMMLVK